MHSCKSSYTKSPATLNPFVPVGNLAMPFTMQRLQQSGELLEQHSDPLTHALARQQHGVTKGSVDAAVAEGKIPLLLTDVEGAEAARAGGLDCWCIFLAPASPEVQHWPELCITCYLRLVATGQNRLPPFTLKLIAVESSPACQQDQTRGGGAHNSCQRFETQAFMLSGSRPVNTG